MNRTYLRPVIYVLLVVAAAFWILSMSSRMPSNLGSIDGRLAECPDSPNCVCSQFEDELHEIEPLRFSGSSPEKAWQALGEVMRSFPRTDILKSTDDYMHCVCTTLLMRFKDDVEFLLNPAKEIIDVRSASRLGHSDLGANRKRIEEIRRLFQDKIGANGNSTDSET